MGLALDVREIVGDAALAAYFDLRWRVLREPWNQSRQTGHDDRDSDSLHLGCWAGDRLVGVGRLHFNTPAEGQVRFMAVEPGFERQGIGRLLLDALERRAFEAGAERVVLDARDSARGFYERQGYRITGPAGLLFDAIVHWRMEKPFIRPRKSRTPECRPARSPYDRPTAPPPNPAAPSRSNRRP